ncbi:zinc-binding alcohol dehydrogenase family protein [Chitinophaga sp. Cy-1792]|uniref:zinc-binding alcohol dehydrogenase family protein n=1 Tax=Chitinophaga sp. Cy-1792 TaxID=2608339 RepID=UPI00141EA70E|nr:zinc-binding alcohol dehydrogenase family protein [Chitinophaga sp. Cy-1792]NIG55295.1 zinc-binding alcohol dehydrogenase family protein [Chitinophaga sp. Cy-1792]
MKLIQCLEPGQLIYTEAPIPALTAGHTLLQIKRIGICGTDIHAYDGTQPYFTYPRILGHELAAEIVETTDPELHPGSKVTIIPYYACGTCIACRQQKPNCCSSIQVAGVHIDGGMKEFMLVPNKAVIAGNDMTLDELALTEPLAISAHGIRRAAVKAGEQVLIMGAGPIGLGAAAFALQAGATVIMLDVNQQRLAFCKDLFPEITIINVLGEDVTGEIAKITNNEYCSVVIDASGNQQAINNCLQYLAHGGRIVLIGLQKKELIYSHPEFHKRETTLMSSRNATVADFQYVMDCIREQKISPLKMITHRATFEEAVAAFPQWVRPENNVIKAMITL